LFSTPPTIIDAKRGGFRAKSFKGLVKSCFFWGGDIAKWCSILKIVRTHFAATGGEAAPMTISSFSLAADYFTN